MRTRVKICGFTRVEDAVFATGLGVDAIGLVFYPPSPRNVNTKQALGIIEALPAFVSTVALFVDADENLVRNVMESAPIDCLQFHGNEPGKDCRKYGKRYIKAIRVNANTDFNRLSHEYSDASALLLDADVQSAYGGTGSRFDWSLIPQSLPLPVILAGGLEPSNAQSAITSVRPYALDVSSGVEAQKGIKDKNKMTAFMNAVYSSDSKTQ